MQLCTLLLQYLQSLKTQKCLQHLAASEDAEMLLFTVLAACENAEMMLFTVFAASENTEMLLFTVFAKPSRATTLKTGPNHTFKKETLRRFRVGSPLAYEPVESQNPHQ